MDILTSNSVTSAPLRTTTPAQASNGTTGKTVSAAASTAITEAKKPVDEAELKDVKQAVSDINKAMQFMSRQLEFSVDTDSDRTIVKVIDQQTREVIRQMPTKEALEIGKALEKAQGLLIKQTA